MNNTNFGTGCEMVESVNTPKSYSMPLKENEMYSVSSTNISETREIIENEDLLPTSPKNEIKSTVISSSVGNESEDAEKAIVLRTIEIQSNNKECSNNEDIDMRLSEEGDSGNLDASITKNLTDSG